MNRTAMRRRLPRLAGFSLSLGLVWALAAAQEADWPEPVDQMTADLNPLATSLRNIEMGLRQPGEFEQVYRLPDGKLMRVQGGLYALFDESIYVTNGKEIRAKVPGNTVFWIGAPPENAGGGEDDAEPAHFPGRIESFIAPLPQGAPPRAASWSGPAVMANALPLLAPRPGAAGRIVWDHDYRAQRLRALMQAAALAAEAR